MANKEVQTDYVLEELVGIANSSGVSVSLTVMTAGGAACGRLVSNEQWFREMGKRLEAAQPEDDRAEGKKGLHTLYESWASSMTTLNQEDRDAEDKLDELPDRYQEAVQELRTPGYLHLINARLLAGGSGSSGSALALRIRIADVTGWSFGEAAD